MTQLCKEHSIKNDDLNQKMKNIKSSLENVILHERKQFNQTQPINSEISIFQANIDPDDEEQPTIMMELNKNKVFALE